MENYGKKAPFLQSVFESMEIVIKNNRPSTNWLLISRKKPRKDEIIPGFRLFALEVLQAR